MTGKIFKRIEKKYLLEETQYRKILPQIEAHLIPDQFGAYTICNIYYDTSHYDLIRHSIEKPTYKEKFRIRSYGVPEPDQEVFLELKKKYEGIVYKRRLSLPYGKIQSGVNDQVLGEVGDQISKEIRYFFHFYHPQPKLYLAYDRIAFGDPRNEAFRLTIDTGIRSRSDHLSLAAGDYGAPLFDHDMYLIELKSDMAMPLWLSQALTQQSIFPVSFSKYGSVYKKDIAVSLPADQIQIKNRRNEQCLTVS